MGTLDLPAYGYPAPECVIVSSMSTTPNQKNANTSYLVFLINDFILNHLCRVHDRFNGDLELALILGEIAHYNVRHVLVERPQRLTPNEVMEQPHRLSSAKGCNALSISAATGIARETVRRKIKILEECGWIRRDSAGELVITDAPSRDFADFNRETAERFLPVFQKLNALLTPPT